jgi:hypothetical protein
MAALIQMLSPRRNSRIDLYRSTYLATIKATGSSAPTAFTIELDRLAPTQPPHPRRSNPHSARRPATLTLPAVSSLGGFRTPAPDVPATAPARPASENLHRTRLMHRSKKTRTASHRAAIVRTDIPVADKSLNRLACSRHGRDGRLRARKAARFAGIKRSPLPPPVDQATLPFA